MHVQTEERSKELEKPHTHAMFHKPTYRQAHLDKHALMALHNLTLRPTPSLHPEHFSHLDKQTVREIFNGTKNLSLPPSPSYNSRSWQRLYNLHGNLFLCLQKRGTPLRDREGELIPRWGNIYLWRIWSLRLTNPTCAEWPQENTATMVIFLHKAHWTTPCLRRLRGVNKQWRDAIDDIHTTTLDFSTTSQPEVQALQNLENRALRDTSQDRSKKRIAADALITPWDEDHETKDRLARYYRNKPPAQVCGPSGHQLLLNLQLINPKLSHTLRDHLTLISLRGCQSLDVGSIDKLFRKYSTYLPRVRRFDMVGLRYELCQQASKSFLLERLDLWSSVHLMGLFTRRQAYCIDPILSSEYIISVLTRGAMYLNEVNELTCIFHMPPDPTWNTQNILDPERLDNLHAVPFFLSATLINMPQVGMFRDDIGKLKIPQWNQTLSGDELDLSLQIATPWTAVDTAIMGKLFPHPDAPCINFGYTAVNQWKRRGLEGPRIWPQKNWPPGKREWSNPSSLAPPTLPPTIIHNMGPHCNPHDIHEVRSIANQRHQLFQTLENGPASQQGEGKRALLPHLQIKNVGPCTRVNHSHYTLEILTDLAREIRDRLGRSPQPHDLNTHTIQLHSLNARQLKTARRKKMDVANAVIHLLCQIKHNAHNRTGSHDYLGTPPPTDPRIQSLDRGGWGAWLLPAMMVSREWLKSLTLRRHLAKSFTMMKQIPGDNTMGEYRIQKELSAISPKYLRYVHIVDSMIRDEGEGHRIIEGLIAGKSNLQELYIATTNTRIGHRMASTLLIQGFGFSDIIELSTWIHGLPPTPARGLLSLLKDSPKETVDLILESHSQLGFLKMATEGSLPELRPGTNPSGHKRKQLPFLLTFDNSLFPRLAYSRNLRHRVNHPATLAIQYAPLRSEPEARVLSIPPENEHLRPYLGTTWTGYENARNLIDKAQGYQMSLEDLAEMYGYDGLMGIHQPPICQGDQVEVRVDDVDGNYAWIPGSIATLRKNLGDLVIKFRGCENGLGHWSKHRKTRDMGITWCARWTEKGLSRPASGPNKRLHTVA